ncbi:MAG: STAS domain-containing protein [Bryobacteraceae bacterium]
MALEVREKEAEGIVILGLHGRLVAGAESGDFRRKMTELISTGHNSIILDMKRVDFIDSTGLGALVVAHTQLQKAGGSVKLLNLSKRHLQLMVLTKLSTVFEIFDDELTALNSFFPDREQKPFDILEFVREQEDGKQHVGAPAVGAKPIGDLKSNG